MRKKSGGWKQPVLEGILKAQRRQKEDQAIYWVIATLKRSGITAGGGSMLGSRVYLEA